jgi:hypothetical protein
MDSEWTHTGACYTQSGYNSHGMDSGRVFGTHNRERFSVHHECVVLKNRPRITETQPEWTQISYY